MVLLHAFLMLKGFSYSLEEGGELHAQKKENHTVLKRHENVNSWINFFFLRQRMIVMKYVYTSNLVLVVVCDNYICSPVLHQAN